jgi:hypothetical protein
VRHLTFWTCRRTSVCPPRARSAGRSRSHRWADICFWYGRVPNCAANLPSSTPWCCTANTRGSRRHRPGHRMATYAGRSLHSRRSGTCRTRRGSRMLSLPRSRASPIERHVEPHSGSSSPPLRRDVACVAVGRAVAEGGAVAVGDAVAWVTRWQWVTRQQQVAPWRSLGGGVAPRQLSVI